MSHPLMSMSVFTARREDMLREINSDEWRARAEQLLQRRLRRAARKAELRHRVSAFRHRSAKPTEVHEVMTIARAH